MILAFPHRECKTAMAGANIFYLQPRVFGNQKSVPEHCEICAENFDNVSPLVL